MKKCPVCNDKIDFRGVIWHLRIIHEFEEWYILEMLLEKISNLENEVLSIKSAQQAQCSRPDQPGTMAQGSASGDVETGG